MISLQFEVGIGTFQVDWTEKDGQPFLSQIHCLVSKKEQGSTHLIRVEQSPYLIKNVVKQIRNFFDTGEPLNAVPWSYIDRRGWTDFQVQVYQSLTMIPHGETRTYSWLASRVGNIQACRAVGQALRKNPLPILIPCHRVVSAQALGGFMGVLDPDQPELKFKKHLIELEHSFLSPPFSFLSATPSFIGNVSFA